MRRLFLVLMIALLPLRGWVGDVMAVEMSTVVGAKNSNATINVANYLYTTWEKGEFNPQKVTSGTPECPGHAATASGHVATAPENSALPLTGDIAASVSAEAAGGHCNTCGACQICHSVALASTVALSSPDVLPHTLPSIGSTRFGSAVAALSHKPPIS